MNILGSLFAGLMSNSVVQGMVAQTGASAIQAWLTQVDASGAVVPMEPWLSKVSLVLAFVVTAINLAMTGQLHTLDVNSAITAVETFAMTFVGTKAAGTQTVTAAVASLTTPATPPATPPATGS